MREITLFALGGLARMDEEARDPNAEFWIGLIGPITSVVIGLACLAGAMGLGWSLWAGARQSSVAVLVWLGYINLLLAIFDMIPGFPLDGGRVLRAVIWWFTGDADRSMLIAARIGQGFALSFILLGSYRFGCVPSGRS